MNAGPSRGFTVALFVVALIVRLLVSHVSGTLTRHPGSTYLQIQSGHMIAMNPASVYAFPLGNFYAHGLLFRLSGENESVYGVALCLVGALLPLLVVRLALLVLPPGSVGAAKAAGWLAAVFPPLVLLSATWRIMLFHVLFALLHALFALDGSSSARRWSVKNVLAGFLLLMCRPDYYLAGLFASLRSRRAWALKMASILLPIAFVAAHNYFMVDRSAPWGGNLWGNLQSGNNPHSREAILGFGRTFWHPEATLTLWADPLPPPDLAGLSENSLIRARLWRFVVQSPVLFVEGLAMKTARLLEVRRDGALGQAGWENVLYSVPLLGCLILFLLGTGMLLMASEGRRTVSTAGWALLGYALPMILIFSLDRTRTVLQVWWLILGSYALTGLHGPVDPARGKTDDPQA